MLYLLLHARRPPMAACATASFGAKAASSPKEGGLPPQTFSPPRSTFDLPALPDAAAAARASSCPRQARDLIRPRASGCSVWSVQGEQQQPVTSPPQPLPPATRPLNQRQLLTPPPPRGAPAQATVYDAGWAAERAAASVWGGSDGDCGNDDSAVFGGGADQPCGCPARTTPAAAAGSPPAESSRPGGRLADWRPVSSDAAPFLQRPRRRLLLLSGMRLIDWPPEHR